MKLKEFGPGGARPKFYYVDPPLVILFKRNIKSLVDFTYVQNTTQRGLLKRSALDVYI